jgi:lauroyl/myristoyl acyltransferase
MRSGWKSFRYRLEWVGVKLLAWLIPRLPRAAVVKLGRISGWLAAHLDRHGRAVALSNLAVAFGDRFSPAERARITRESYQQFASTMLDLFWNPRINAANWNDYIEFEGWDEFARTVGPTGPCIIAACHYGNFEWFSLAAAYKGLVATIVSQEFKNSLLDPIFNRLREQSGHQFVPREGAIVRLYKTLRRGGTAAILIDLTLDPRQPAVVIDCFGMKMPVTYAHAWLYRRTGMPIVPVHQEPLPGGRCRVVFHPTLEIPEGATDREIAQLCWNQFEPVIRANPSPWLWMYKYWRFRPNDADRSYPAYSRPVRRFDALVAQMTQRNESTSAENRQG